MIENDIDKSFVHFLNSLNSKNSIKIERLLKKVIIIRNYFLVFFSQRLGSK